MTWWEKFRAWPLWAQALAWLGLFPVVLVVFTVSHPTDQRRAWWFATACASVAWLTVAATTADDDDQAVAVTFAEVDTTTSVAEPGASVSEDTQPEILASPEGAYRAADAETTDEPKLDPFVRTLDSNTLLDVLASLPVQPESARAGYERDLFRHWDDEDGDGCDTRCEILSAQRRPDGAWLSEWDGYRTNDTTELHVDHVVALAEAWDSGADTWSRTQRDEFADWMPNLLAVTAAANVAKSDRDAAEWFPSRAEANCLWASTVVRVKSHWGLSVDEAERDALGNLLRTCGDHQPPATPTTQPPTTLPPPPPPLAAPLPVAPPPPATSDCTSGYSPCIPPGDDVDCAGGSGNGPRYADGPITVNPGGGDPYGLDSDGDGVGCES